MHQQYAKICDAKFLRSVKFFQSKTGLAELPLTLAVGPSEQQHVGLKSTDFLNDLLKVFVWKSTTSKYTSGIYITGNQTVLFGGGFGNNKANAFSLYCNFEPVCRGWR